MKMRQEFDHDIFIRNLGESGYTLITIKTCEWIGEQMVSVSASNSNTKGSVEVILSPKEASLLSASLLAAIATISLE